MSSDDKGEKYWLGVRDALRMVDSFLRWSKNNPEQAKTLDAFISEGLIAAAKRCEECLSKDLGLTFKQKEDGSVEMAAIDEPTDEPTAIMPDGHETTPETSMHFEIEEVESEVVEDPAETLEPLEEDTIEPLAPEVFGDPSSSLELSQEELGAVEEPPARDFGSEFSIDEPTALVIDSEEAETEDEIETPPSDSGITWREYEDLLSETPSMETEHVGEMVEDIHEDGPPIPPPLETETGPSEHATVESDRSARWSPYDEPSIDSEEIEFEEEEDSELIELDEAESESDVSEGTPPPPPPPPESDETEEERRRRARRLFFGT
ncbi:MAG: hypothetical protein JSW61_11615 [Candidatus Thorarchaeota archaeon]|nr:MAG: hypothetical protein JSW61_11615 [Candidatus Thorarchaeota archaeon]